MPPDDFTDSSRRHPQGKRQEDGKSQVPRRDCLRCGTLRRTAEPCVCGYEPRVEGMAAAMPHIDDFLPIHNLESLDQLARHLGSLPTR